MKLSLLDRDGVVVVNRPTNIKTPEEIELIEGVAEAIAALNGAGYKVAICTNQAEIGRGVLTPDQVRRVHDALVTMLSRRGAEVDKLRDDLQKEMGREVHINIQEIQRPELDSQLVSESIAGQLERRVSFRRAMKKAMESAFRFGAKGVKIMVAGRLGGAEIARTEWYQEGRLPLHTLKADIDYGFGEARTTYGVIGVKVWIYKGDLLREKGRRATA